MYGYDENFRFKGSLVLKKNNEDVRSDVTQLLNKYFTPDGDIELCQLSDNLKEYDFENSAVTSMVNIGILEAKLLPFIESATFDFEIWPYYYGGEEPRYERHTLSDGKWYAQEGEITYSEEKKELDPVGLVEKLKEEYTDESYEAEEDVVL